MHTLRFVALAALALVAAACTPGAVDDAPGDGDADACPDTIAIRDFAYEPASCSVEAGATLTFVNEDDVPHTATTDPEATAAFDTGTLEPGESATVTVEEAGTYPYHCELHPSMQASIEVEAVADAGAASSGANY